MERYWNLVHYFIYRTNVRAYILLNKINPIIWSYRLPFMKRRFKKMGIDDPVASFNDVLTNPEIGFSSILSGGAAYGLVYLFGYGLIFFFSVVSGVYTGFTAVHVVVPLLLSFIANYALLFRKDKYLVYFEEFDKLPEAARRKWSLVTFATVVGIFAFAIGSCMGAIHS